jgi:hypothetical protein
MPWIWIVTALLFLVARTRAELAMPWMPGENWGWIIAGLLIATGVLIVIRAWLTEAEA